MNRGWRTRLPPVAALLAALVALVVVVAISLRETGPVVASGSSAAGASTSNSAAASTTRLRGRNLQRDLGQMIVATFTGTEPTRAILSSIRAGDVGGIILLGDNTVRGIAATRVLVQELQAAAKSGRNPPLLIMTDEEGGEVQRLGTPFPSASDMASPAVALRYGILAGQTLKSAGINLDLAPVADVARVDGFVETAHRSFGSSPPLVADAACAFARGLREQGIGYTLKYFPGLGSAIDSTDNVPVSITEPLAELREDEAAYRKCAGSSPLGLVMVSSASYTALTGTVPAVLDSEIYSVELPKVVTFRGVTISDNLEAGALVNVTAPAKTAIDAGLDLLLYAGSESASRYAYTKLLGEAEAGIVDTSRIAQAYGKIETPKKNLGLR